MPFPLVPVITVLGQATVQVMTKPAPWIFFASWLILSNFDLSVFSTEVRTTFASLWWVVVLVLVGIIANTAARAHFKSRHRLGRRGRP